MTAPDHWSPKWLTEALASQETHAPDAYTGQQISNLIYLLRVHRPVGRDGKHGDRHTATCGCEDNPFTRCDGQAATGREIDGYEVWLPCSLPKGHLGPCWVHPADE